MIGLNLKYFENLWKTEFSILVSIEVDFPILTIPFMTKAKNNNKKEETMEEEIPEEPYNIKKDLDWKA